MRNICNCKIFIIIIFINLFNNIFFGRNNKPVSWWNNGDFGPWINGISLCDRNDLITDYIAPLNSMTLDDVKNIPYEINDHGTYQYVLELSESEVIDLSLIHISEPTRPY